ncbi:hypothetical protein [Musicola keenii]|uniref:hypothetical protein n=1 Tax=Musicola keenii TaxID=2884250 RepID=UPI00178512F0|nr:hypothetical protein [Musicola keenii]
MSTPEDAFKKKLLADKKEKDELVQKHKMDSEHRKKIIAERIDFYQKHQSHFIQKINGWASSVDLNISDLNVNYYDYGNLFQTKGISIEHDGKKVQFIPKGVERGTFLGTIALDFPNANPFIQYYFGLSENKNEAEPYWIFVKYDTQNPSAWQENSKRMSKELFFEIIEEILLPPKP